MARSRKVLAAGAVGVAALALIAASSSVTGAYYLDAHDGSINASSGNAYSSVSNLKLDFTDLLPGVPAEKPVSYTANGTDREDIWLVLPATKAYALNGIADVVGQKEAALGRYGHFAVTKGSTTLFTSFNLAAPGTTEGHTGAPCYVDGNGHGGSSAEANDLTEFPAYCPAPKAILLSSNLAKGEEESVKITFGLTKLVTGPQNAGLARVAEFQIVSTQHGITPQDAEDVQKR